MNGYIEQFQGGRGEDYAGACEIWRGVRRREVELLLPLCRGIKRVCDVPAGSGIAGRHAQELYDCEVHAVEPTAMAYWLPLTTSFKHSESLSDLPSEHFDLIASLAGMHHLLNAERFFRELARIAKWKGFLAFADVEEGTEPARFLKEVVGGHDNAQFLTSALLNDLVNNAGFKILSSDVRTCPWVFDRDRGEMLAFLTDFFSLKQSPDAIRVEVNRIFGVDPARDKELPWKLRYLLAVKR